MIKADISDSEKLTLLLDFDRVLGLGLSGWKQKEVPTEIQRLMRNAIHYEKRKNSVSQTLFETNRSSWI